MLIVTIAYPLLVGSALIDSPDGEDIARFEREVHLSFVR